MKKARAFIIVVALMSAAAAAASFHSGMGINDAPMELSRKMGPAPTATPEIVYENSDGNIADWAITGDTDSGNVGDMGSDIRFLHYGSNDEKEMTRFQYQGGTSPWGMDMEIELTFVTGDASHWRYSIGGMEIKLTATNRYWYINNDYYADHQLSGGELINTRITPLGGTNYNVAIEVDDVEIVNETKYSAASSDYFEVYLEAPRYDANMRSIRIDDILIKEH